MANRITAPRRTNLRRFPHFGQEGFITETANWDVFTQLTEKNSRPELNRSVAAQRGMISTVLRLLLLCAFRSLFAARQHSKPMNYGVDGIHRMFQLK
jgi:hypothetical protein